MAWDSSRPVPWQRLMREWSIYALVMVGLVFLFVRGNTVGALAGILVSGPLYLAFGAVLAKFGYQRKTLRQLREEREAQQEASPSEASGSAATTRTRPPPTKRTSTGPNRPRGKRRR